VLRCSQYISSILYGAKKIQELEANGGTVEELWLLFKTRLNQSVIDHIPHKTAKQKDGNGKCPSICGRTYVQVAF
jgi:hypothetical protein